MAEFELKALITGVDRLSPQLSKMQKNIKRLRKTTEESGEGGLIMGAGLAAGLGVAMVAFAEQEDAAMGLKVAMMDAKGEVGDTYEKINNLAVGLGNQLPGTTADFQNMMQTLVRQGIPAESILNGVGKASAYLAVQLKKTPEAAAEFAAKMQDATGTASQDMMGLFDTIQRAFYLGVDDTNMLSFFTKTSSIIRMVDKDGLKAAQSLAPIAVMMDQMGMAGEASGNALRKVVQAGLDVGKVKQFNDAMKVKKIPVQLDFTNGKGQFGGLDNMLAQLEKLKSFNDVERTKILKNMFGDDAETLQVVNALIDKGRAGVEQVSDRMMRQADLNKRVEAQLGTLSNLWEAMTGTAVNGLAAVGGAFGEDSKRLVTLLSDLGEWFSNFAKQNPAVIRGAVGIAAGFVAIKFAMIGINFALGLISKTIGLSPLGIFLRVAAVAAGLVIANWSTIAPFFQKMWSGIKSWFASGVTFLKAVFAEYNPFPAIVAMWGGLTNWFSGLWEGVKFAFDIGVGFIKAMFLDLNPLPFIKANWEPIVKWFADLWARIEPYINPIANGITTVKNVAGAGMKWLFGEDESAPAGGGGVANYNPAGVYKPGAYDDPEGIAARSKPSGAYSGPDSLTDWGAPGGANNGPVNPPDWGKPGGVFTSKNEMNGKIVVDFQNAPQGMRVTETKTNDPLSLDYDVGYNRFARQQ